MYKLNFLKVLFFLVSIFAKETIFSQTIINAEYLVGKTSPANIFFPELDLNQTASISIGKKHIENISWINELNFPETGVTLEYTNYGNQRSIGSSFSLLPYLELPLFKSKTNKLRLNSAMGVSYFNKIYSESENWQNKAISTHFTWSYRMFLYYDLFTNSNIKTRASLGYTHHSNGHLKWPNNGLNTFLIGLNFKIQKLEKTTNTNEGIDQENIKSKSFYSFKTGIGQQSLSRLQNTNKEVYTTSFSYGKIYKNTYKIGVGLFYNFYENYYDYIKNNGFFVKEEYPELKNNIIYNSSAYGVFINGEILMNHIGIEAQLGINIDKPFYKIDYRINSEVYNNQTNGYDIGELDNGYKIKRFVSGKLGIKYYLLNTKNSPKNNISIGANICSNLGQADYSEMNIGYTYLLN